jgi:hypothetical protein
LLVSRHDEGRDREVDRGIGREIGGETERERGEERRRKKRTKDRKDNPVALRVEAGKLNLQKESADVCIT